MTQTTPYALRMSDGSVAVLHLVNGADLNETVAKYSAVHGAPVEVVQVEHKDLPTDRSYRDSWTFAGKRFGHDMAKAREIHRDKVRIARAPMLKALDVEVSKALAKGESAAALETERQRLRDATADPRIEAAENINALKAAWPL